MMYEDKPFENITQRNFSWAVTIISGVYMRSNGIDESYITGDKSDMINLKRSVVACSMR